MNAAQRHAVALTRAVADDDTRTTREILAALNHEQTRALILELARRAGPTDTDAERVLVALTHACGVFGTEAHEVLSGSRRPEDVDARMVACYVSWMLGCSYSLIGRQIGRDHSTVMSAVARVGEQPRLREVATRVATRLGWDRNLATPVGEPA